jgi:hypothetical protein
MKHLIVCLVAKNVCKLWTNWIEVELYRLTDFHLRSKWFSLVQAPIISDGRVATYCTDIPHPQKCAQSFTIRRDFITGQSGALRLRYTDATSSFVMINNGKANGRGDKWSWLRQLKCLKWAIVPSSHAMNRAQLVLNGTHEKSTILTLAWWDEAVSWSSDDDAAGLAVVWGSRGENYGTRVLSGISRRLQGRVQTAAESSQRLETSEELASNHGQETDGEH